MLIREGKLLVFASRNEQEFLHLAAYAAYLYADRSAVGWFGFERC